MPPTRAFLFLCLVVLVSPGTCLTRNMIEPVWTYSTGHATPILDLQISSDESVIAAADGSLYLLDRNGTILTKGWSASVVAMSKNPPLLATAGEASVCQFDPQGTKLWCNNEFAGEGNQVLITEDGSRIAAGSDRISKLYYFDGNGTILWNGITGTPIYDMAMPASGSFIVAAAADNRITSYTSNGALRINLYQSDFRAIPLTALEIPYDGRFIIGGMDNGNGGKVLLMDTGLNILWENVTQGLARTLAISRDGSRVVVGDWNVEKNTEARVYYYAINRTAKNGELNWTYPLAGRSSCLAMTPNGTYIAVGTMGNTLYSFDGNGTPLWNYTINTAFSSVSISDSGSSIVAGSRDGVLYYFSQNLSSFLPAAQETSVVTTAPITLNATTSLTVNTTIPTETTPVVTNTIILMETTPNPLGPNSTPTDPWGGYGSILLISVLALAIVAVVVAIFFIVRFRGDD
jgi:WD40 repeat protein